MATNASKRKPYLTKHKLNIGDKVWFVMQAGNEQKVSHVVVETYIDYFVVKQEGIRYFTTNGEIAKSTDETPAMRKGQRILQTAFDESALNKGEITNNWPFFTTRKRVKAFLETLR